MKLPANWIYGLEDCEETRVWLAYPSVERGKAVDPELLETQALAALCHIQRIAAEVVVHPAELDIGKRLTAVGRPCEHDLVPEYVAGLVALVGDVDGSVRRDGDRGALVKRVGIVAHSDRVGPSGAEVVRHGLHDIGRDVPMSFVALEE